MHQKTLTLLTLMGSLIVTPIVFAQTNSMSAVQNTNPVAAGSVLQVRGWYEHYGNGQIVLYPAVNPNQNSMGGQHKSNLPSMASMPSMGDMPSMADMPSMMGAVEEGIVDAPGGEKIPKVYRMTYGQFWIDSQGNLLLQPIKRTSDMLGMEGMTDEQNNE
jgi:hypothetical protein